ncbi:histidine kinase [Microseira wollei NIES-4236]|uniref:histidine kinase n=1 Tax=Microseira wollei NIES-4236 TaxID=2530354 RepID=A0AAV3XI39_9CYAN|nr:HAMP domain-containing sensor histidine kinase [Microseira wollei]GET40169.1 histidine kinase [Microseira wollei NIES-4236]
MNILSNGIDALEQGNGLSVIGDLPTIHISTAVTGDNCITLRIADNGQGMTEAVKKHIFDPFFTTKPVGQGTGLGLAISYQIVVEKHGGNLLFSSAPGRGTELWIEIPIRQSNKHQ